jgi:hypothetical protein
MARKRRPNAKESLQKDVESEKKDESMKEEEKMGERDGSKDRPSSSDKPVEKEKEKTKYIEAPSSDGDLSRPGDSEIKPNMASELPTAVPTENVIETVPSVDSGAVDLLSSEPKVKLVRQMGSVIKVENTPYDHIMYSKTLMEIGSFSSPLEFLKARFELAKKLVSTFSGLIVDPPTKIEDSSQETKITDPKAMGWDIRTHGSELNSVIAKVRQTLRGLSVDSVNRYQETYQYCGRPWEHNLLDSSQFYATRGLQRVGDIREVFNSLLSTTKYFVSSVPEEWLRVPDSHLVEWEIMDRSLYIEFLDKNRVLQALFVDAANKTIRDNIEVRAVSEATTMNTIRKALSVSVNTASDLHDIGMSISESTAIDTFLKILKSKLFNRYYALEFTVKRSVFSWVAVVECILLKLIMPEHSLTLRSRTMIHNYLLMHFFQHLTSGWSNVGPANAKRGAAINPTRRYAIPDKDFETIDYLMMQISLLPPQYQSFIGQWGDGPNKFSHTFSNAPAGYGKLSQVSVVGRTLGFKLWGGEIVNDWADTIPQIENFKSFEARLTADLFYSGMVQGTDKSIRRLLQFLISREDELKQLYYYSNEFLARMCVSPLCTPEDRSEDTEYGMYIDQIKLGGMLSLLTIAMPATFHTELPDLKLILAGNGAIKVIREYIAAYYLATDFMPKKSYFKSEIIEAALKLIDDSPIQKALGQVVLGAPEKHYVVMPARIRIQDPTTGSEFYNRITEAIKLVDDYPTEFGYAKEWFAYFQMPFQDNTTTSHVALHEHYVLPPLIAANAVTTLTYTDLLDTVSSNQYATILMNAINNARPIKFDFPIKIKLVEGAPNSGARIPPVNYLRNTKGVQEDMMKIDKPIEIFYQWEEYFKIRTSDVAMELPPTYLVVDTPLKIEPLDDYLNDIRKKTVFRRGLTIHTIEEIVRIVRRSDI